MSRLLPPSASWDQSEGQKSNLTHHSAPSCCDACDSVAKFRREDLEMRLRRRRRALSGFSLILGLDSFCLSGCFSKPPHIGVGLRRAASECPLRLE